MALAREDLATDETGVEVHNLRITGIEEEEREEDDGPLTGPLAVVRGRVKRLATKVLGGTEERVVDRKMRKLSEIDPEGPIRIFIVNAWWSPEDEARKRPRELLSVLGWNEQILLAVATTANNPETARAELAPRVRSITTALKRKGLGFRVSDTMATSWQLSQGAIRYQAWQAIIIQAIAA